MANERCYAPVFEGHSILECLFLIIAIILLIVALIVGTLGLILLSAKGRCVIKQYQFRMSHCCQGNDNPKLPI
jgi:hypothetical protein